MPKKAAAPAVAEVPTPDPIAARLAELQKSIDVLNQTIDRLEAIPPEQVAALPLEQRKARAHAKSDAFLAIEDLENAKLETLNNEFESRRPSLAWATSKLEDDLAKLTDTVAFIAAAASAIGIVADIASLVA